MATRDVLRELVSRYQLDTSRAVSSEAAGGIDVAKRVQDGEAVDVVVLAGNVIDRLIAEKKLLAGSRVDLVNSGIAIAIRANSLRPEVGTEDAVRNAVLAARTLSYSTGPSGIYLEKLFERWGILDAIRDRIVVPPPGVAVGSLVAGGTAELGFQQLSELKPIEGIEIVGLIPGDTQKVTIFSGGISSSSNQPEAAKSLLNYLSSAKARPTIEKTGLEPMTGQ